MPPTILLYEDSLIKIKKQINEFLKKLLHEIKKN